MVEEPILAQIKALNVWSRNGERAPHKPLLLLLALGRFQRGETELAYVECEEALSELLREFGPNRSSIHPEYPFWRLQNDGLWLVSFDAPLTPRKSNSDPTKGSLRASNAVGRFPEAMQVKMHENPTLIREIAALLLRGHFPASLHYDILSAVGLSLESSLDARQSRDPRFRTRILRAYEFRCAVCGFDLRITNITIGLEAAHIRWHQAGGPDTEDNGIALCSLHHKLLDLGAFTIHEDYRVLISELVHGGDQFEHILLRHHGQMINYPSRPEHQPSALFVSWHRREVFKGGARFLVGFGEALGATTND